MLVSKDSGIDMSETEIEPGLVLKRKISLNDVTVEQGIKLIETLSAQKDRHQSGDKSE